MPISNLTPEHVRAMAEAAHLRLTPDDLVEVTHRLNAFLEALTPLGELPLDKVEPIPVPPERDPAS